MSEHQRELEIVRALLRRAGELALDVYRRPFGADRKADRSPVTEADRVVNAFLCEQLAAAFPGDLVVGEESGFDGAVPATGRAWFVDPIDGTKDFILKNDEWSIMAGLAVDGVATVGVVFEPAVDRMYFAAAGAGAWRVADGQTTRLMRASAKPASDAVVVNSRNHPDPRIQRIVERLGITEQFEHGSVGCKLARIAEGRADVYFNFSGRCAMWDTCGPEAIIREAGGDLVDTEGRHLVYAGASTAVKVGFFAATSAVLDPVAAAVDALRAELRPDP